MKQLEFDYPPESRANTAYPEILSLIGMVASEAGREQVANRLDVSPSTLTNRLQDRYHLPVRDLLYFLQLDPGRVLGWLAEFVGYRVERVRKLTPEEELAELKDRVRAQFGPAGEQAIQDAGGVAR